MEIINKDMQIINSVNTATNQLLLEGDMIVPDSNADVGMLLLKNADCYITGSDIVKDRISYKGNMEINVMYTSKDNPNEIGSLKVIVPFSDFSVLDNSDKSITADVYCKITNIEYKIINCRKVNYRAIVDIISDIMETKNISPIEKIEDSDDVSQLTEKANIDKVVCCKNDRFYIKDSISIAMGKPNIAEILYNNAYISSKEIKPLTDKISISGILKLFTAYRATDNENGIEYLENEIPFNTMVEADGSLSDYNAHVRIALEDKFINISQDNDDEDRVIDIEISVGCHCMIIEKCEEYLLNDVYCIDKFIRTETDSTELYEFECRNLSICNIREIIKFDENCPPAVGLIRSEAMPVLDEVTNADGKITANGAVNLQIYYSAKDDSRPYYCFSAMIPFSQRIEAGNININDDLYKNLYVSPENVTVNMLSEKEAEVRCQVCLDMYVYKRVLLEYIKNIIFTDMDSEILDKIPSIVIYVVQKGDTLWKIAKRYNTTIDRIVKINDIENPDLIYPGEKFIILKNSGKNS